MYLKVLAKRQRSWDTTFTRHGPPVFKHLHSSSSFCMLQVRSDISTHRRKNGSATAFSLLSTVKLSILLIVKLSLTLHG
jgi:hypothetical protein